MHTLALQANCHISAVNKLGCQTVKTRPKRPQLLEITAIQE